MGRNRSTMLSCMADSFANAGGDYHTTYFPQPTILSSRRFYLHVDGSNYMELDFRRPDVYEIAILNRPKRLLFNAAPTILNLVQKLSGFLGRQPELPEWIYNGVILGVQGGTERVRHELISLRRNVLCKLF